MNRTTIHLAQLETVDESVIKRHHRPKCTCWCLSASSLLNEWQHAKRNMVAERLACDFTDWKTDSDKFDAQLEQVIKALRTDDGGREPAPVPKL